MNTMKEFFPQDPIWKDVRVTAIAWGFQNVIWVTEIGDNYIVDAQGNTFTFQVQNVFAWFIPKSEKYSLIPNKKWQHREDKTVRKTWFFEFPE